MDSIRLCTSDHGGVFVPAVGEHQRRFKCQACIDALRRVDASRQAERQAVKRKGRAIENSFALARHRDGRVVNPPPMQPLRANDVRMRDALERCAAYRAIPSLYSE